MVLSPYFILLPLSESWQLRNPAFSSSKLQEGVGCVAACGGMKIIRAFLVDEQSRRARAQMSLGAKRKQERTHRRNELRSHVKVVSWVLHTYII